MDGTGAAPDAVPGGDQGTGDGGDGGSTGGGGAPARDRHVLRSVAVGAVLVAAGVGIGFALAGGGDDPSEPAEEAGASEPDEPEATTTTAAPTTTTTSTTTPPVRWQTIQGVEGEFTLDLPADWAYAAVDDDASGAAARLFPTDPDNQAFAQGIVDLVATTGPRLVAADADDDIDTSVSMLAIERQPYDRGLETTVDIFLQSYADAGVTDVERRDLTGAFGPLAAVQNTEVGRIDYFFVGGGTTWKLAYIASGGQVMAESGTADEIAMSFAAS